MLMNEAHHRNMGLWNFQEDCSIAIVLWTWAFCTTFLSNCFTLIVLCLDVSLCDLYSQSWQNGLPKQLGRPQFHLSLSNLWCVLVDKRVAKFWKGMNGLFWMGCIAAFLLLAIFFPKRDLSKLQNLKMIFFWRILITKSEGRKNSKNSHFFIFGFEWVAKDRKG